MIFFLCLVALSLSKFWCDVPINIDNYASINIPSGYCIRFVMCWLFFSPLRFMSRCCCCSKFAKVNTPRTLDIAPNGDVFVGSPSSGTPGGAPPGIGGVYALYDDNKDGVADDATNLFMTADPTVHGIRIVGNRLYYSESEAVKYVTYAMGDRKASASEVPKLFADLSHGGFGDRFTHTIDYDAVNGDLYVTTGRYDAYSCDPNDEARVGAVLRINELASGAVNPGDVIVRGCRNPMYLRCKSFGCYAMELTGDSWGYLGGTEKLFKVVNNTDLGFPCCVQKNVPFVAGNDCSKVSTHLLDININDTPFGFDWDDANVMTGAAHKGALFIAMHGSFSGWVNAGVGYVRWNYTTNRPVMNAYEQFIPGGFGHQGTVARGRPADLIFHHDGFQRSVFYNDSI